MATKPSKETSILEPSLENLSISSSKPAKSKQPPDSWEAEDEGASSAPPSPSTPTQVTLPGPPPPTPVSPTHRDSKSTDWATFPQQPSGEEKRPEKSSAVAGRLIAGALGVKTKMTEEQGQYERAVREKERRRIEAERNEGRRKEREREEARRAVWDD